MQKVQFIRDSPSFDFLRLDTFSPRGAKLNLVPPLKSLQASIGERRKLYIARAHQKAVKSQIFSTFRQRHPGEGEGKRHYY